MTLAVVHALPPRPRDPLVAESELSGASSLVADGHVVVVGSGGRRGSPKRKVGRRLNRLPGV